MLQVFQKLAPEISTAYLTVSQPWLAGFDIDEFQQSEPAGASGDTC